MSAPYPEFSWPAWYRFTPPAPAPKAILPPGLVGYRARKLAQLREAWRDRCQFSACHLSDFDQICRQAVS